MRTSALGINNISYNDIAYYDHDTLLVLFNKIFDKGKCPGEWRSYLTILISNPKRHLHGIKKFYEAILTVFSRNIRRKFCNFVKCHSQVRSHFTRQK